MSYHTPLDTNMLTLKNQTRAERKRAMREQEKKNAVYQLTREQIEQMKYEVRYQTLKEDIKIIENIMYSAFIIALHDKEGFGKTRINRTLMHAMEQLECIKQGYLTKEELKALAEQLKGKANAITDAVVEV